MNDPHCYGKMDWILKYPEDAVPSSSICSCNFAARCIKLTRNKEQTYEDCYKPNIFTK